VSVEPLSVYGMAVATLARNSTSIMDVGVREPMAAVAARPVVDVGALTSCGV